MDYSSPEIQSELIDLTAIPLTDLRACDDPLLAPSLRRVLAQVERPRPNMGGSGPPGRAD